MVVPLTSTDLATVGIFETIVDNSVGGCSLYMFGTSFMVTP